MVAVGALSIVIGVWVAPAVLVFVTIVLVETCSWFVRRVRALSRRRARMPRGFEWFSDEAPTTLGPTGTESQSDRAGQRMPAT